MSALGHLLAHQGLLREAERTLRQAIALGEEDGVQLPWPSTGKAHIYLGEVLYKSNDLTDAAQHLRRGIQLCEQWRHVYHMTEGMMILAKVQVAQDDLNKGIATLEHAKHIAEEAIFSASKTVSIPKLRHLSNQVTASHSELLAIHVSLKAVTGLTNQFGLGLIDVPKQTPENSLSQRELTVLSLLANRLSSVEIAKELIVSVSTIRTHIKHIYVKLDVHTRNEVIERARMLTLI